MKTCASCGYRNADAASSCGICGKDISALKADPSPSPKKAGKPDFDMLFLVLLGLVAWLYFGFRGMDRPAGNGADPAGKAFSNDGVIYTLEKMAVLKLPGVTEMAAVREALENGDWKVRAAGVKTAGEWLRTGAADIRVLLPGLVSALADPHPGVKKEAVMETGLLLGLGKIGPADVPELGKKVRVFMDDPYDPLKSAGYFLAAMSGQSVLEDRLEHALKYEPLPLTRLYAACALAGLGSKEGSRAVYKAARGPDVNIRREAALCLSYAAAPEAIPLLRDLSASDPDPEVASNAKFSLNLRKQLAIINNKSK